MPFNAWHDLPTGPNPPHVLNAIVEIPRGSRNKYELDKPTGLIRFDRLLYSAVHYPGDYGFFPRTLADDGDPLDVVVMVTAPTFPDCLLEVRPLGVFSMRDEKGLDEKVLAVPTKDPLYDDYRGLADVPRHFLREVEHFFAIYKELEGVRTDTMGWQELDEVVRILQESRDRYAASEGRSG
jgi:inorganic pyrophosphatase